MNSLGSSKGKGFTPRGEKHLAPSSVEGKIPCILTGKNIFCPTTVYVKPGKVGHAIEVYAAKKEKLTPPKAYDLAGEVASKVADLAPMALISDELLPTPVPSTLLNKKARAIICLNDGRYFPSVKLAGNHYHISAAIISCNIAGTTRQAKGRRFRYATPEEIMARQQDITWQYTGELLPLVTGTRKF